MTRIRLRYVQARVDREGRVHRGLPISLGRYCDRREAALPIAEAHHGGDV
jgi:hypothetical protein